MSANLQPMTKLLAIRVALVLAVGTFVLTNCTNLPTKTATKPNQLLVSAAISLKEALAEISEQFQKEENCTVTFNYASTGELAAQLRNGAPVDVFISASPELIDQLLQQQIIQPGTVREIAGNKLVMISSSTREFRNPEDLRNAQIVSIGNPQTVPAGTYAAEALRTYKLYDALLDKKKLVFAENARQVLTYVEQGDADAGIVYNTDAKLCSGCKTFFEIAESAAGSVIYKAGIVKGSKAATLAEKFMRQLESPSAKDILKSKGFMIE